jgi:N-acyl-D-amino-acid deacylase
MRRQLREALQQGALGLSTGLAYASANQSSTEEVMALAEELAAEKGIYTTHLRSEFEPILEALDEAFRIGRHGKVPVVVSHHKCAGAKNWGRTKETLAFFDKMRQHQDISCDCYPYSASSSTLDMKQITDEFDIIITWSEPHPEVAGQTLQQIADGWQMTLHDAGKLLMPAGAIYYNMDEQDVRRVMRYPVTMMGSDGLPNDPMPHPRLWGAFPRVLGHYCRDEQLFPLTQAVHKMTGMSAARFQLPQRGLVKVGYYADLVLFDPQTVRDVASFSDPKQPAEGIEAVMVNGVMSYGSDKRIIGRAGRFLRRQDTVKE